MYSNPNRNHDTQCVFSLYFLSVVLKLVLIQIRDSDESRYFAKPIWKVFNPLNRTDMNWTELEWTELNYAKLMWTWLYWVKLCWTDPNWIKPNWTRTYATPKPNWIRTRTRITIRNVSSHCIFSILFWNRFEKLYPLFIMLNGWEK